VPIRYVLNEVVIHCNSALRSLPIGGSAGIINQDIETPYPGALNVIIAQIPSTFAGQPDGYATYSGRYSVLRNITADNFVHEIGHNFSLIHPHEGPNTLSDGCEDTYWYAPVDWDGNGDGTIDEANINVCWDNTPNPPNFSGDPCEQSQNTNLVNPHPCCSWWYQHLNVMAHGSYKTIPTIGFFTPCQMDRALTSLSGPKCDVIADINPGCPVPSAIIGNDPTRDIEADCYFGLNFRASMTDDDFRVLVEMKDANGNYVPYNVNPSFIADHTNWTTGPADGFTVVGGYLDVQQLAHTLLLQNREYRIILEVRNLCGDISSDAIEFTSGSACNRPRRIVKEDEVDVYPNPFWDGTTLTYQTLESADIQIFTSGFNTSGTYQPPTLKSDASGQKEAGIYQVDFTNVELSNGINYIFIVADGVTYVKSVVKQ
jgi:hypothetical protein